MDVSKHGSDRMRKRRGIPKASVDRAVEKAIASGRKHSEFKGRFLQYLNHQAKFYKTAPVIFGQDIYWIKDGTLITVYPVPAKFRKYL